MEICGSSSRVRATFTKRKVGGSSPTLPLHIFECSIKEIQSFIEQWHYSKSCFGVTCSVAFRVNQGTELVGAAIFGLPAGTGVYKKYSDQNRLSLLELRRFCLIDRLPKNSESFCIGVMLRELRRRGVQRILSYADPAYQHTGHIYKACGFTLMGKTAKRRHFVWNGKRYPDRNVHQVHFPYHKELRAAIANGEVERIEVIGKFIYVKDL